MKGIKKLLTGILAATMIMGCTISAYADEPGSGTAAAGESGSAATAASSATYTLTIDDSREGRSFVAYQIVTGDLSTNANNDMVLSSPRWGSALSNAGVALTAAEQATLEALNGDDAAVRSYAAGLTNLANPYTSGGSAGNYTFTLPAGWYLIKEVTQTNGEDDFTSAFMMEVVGDAQAHIKGSKTQVEKKVQDINDSESTTLTDLQDSADYDIGDVIPYTLTATLGDNLQDYTKYKLIFTDEMSAGLTYGELKSLTIDGNSKDISNVVVADGTTELTGYTAKTFTIADVIGLGATAGSTVVIEYTCTLNQNAVIGSAGNPNYVYLEYSNNPYSDEYGKTPKDKNIVFTYKVIVNKVDSKGNPLTGAGFTLYKKVADTSISGAQTGAAIKAAYTNSSIKADKLDDATYYVVAGVATVDDGTKFNFSGLDDGYYVLVETTIPTGYNAFEAEQFKIEAGHDVESDDPELKTLTATDSDTTNGDIFTGEAASVSLETGTITTAIVNASGLILPSTGGIGTTIFYIIGGILIIAGVAYFILRRKASAE